MLRVIALASFLALAGCHRQASAPGDAPGNFKVEPGDGVVTVSWDQQPGLTYWIFFRAGATVTAASPAASLIFDAQSPRVIGPLANGSQYAFVMNATNHDSRGGPSTPVVSAVPRLAGATWASGAPLGSPPQNLNGVAYSGALNRIVAVGDLGSFFAGDFNYTSASPPGVTAWTQPTSIPNGFVSDLSAVISSGGQFVALGTDGSIVTSTDGNAWVSTFVAPIPNNGMNSLGVGLVSGAIKYVAVGNGGSIFTSTDLNTWTPAAASNTISDLYSVSFFNNGFVATGASGTLLTSTDASTWTPQISNTPNALRGATFGTGSAGTSSYVAVGDSGTIVTSTDGTTWSLAPPPLSQDLRAIHFGSRFVAVGRGGAVVYSDDAVNWSLASVPGSPDLSSIIFTPAMYLAVGALGANAVSK
ncbi:MAG: hypothetical protein E6H51_05055 [Betaproteobacteria bacterium]|nr:MAG: hypothetical protein E6H51_05055 [Betaproteobacteria bacterium]